MQNALHLAEVLANRLCHDLASPLGGMLGALEVAAREPDAMADAAEAGLTLRRRFVLLRAAWGSAPEAMDAAELRNLVQGLPSGRRVAVTIALDPQTGAFPPVSGRLVLNALLLASESVPRGSVTLTGGAGGRAGIAIAGPNAHWPDGLHRMFESQAAAWAAMPAPTNPAGGRYMQAPLTALLVHAAGARASLQPGEPGALPVLHLDLSGVR